MNLGRTDAQGASRHVGRFEEYQVKHAVADSDAVDRTHPVDCSIPESFERWTKALEDDFVHAELDHTKDPRIERGDVARRASLDEARATLPSGLIALCDSATYDGPIAHSWAHCLKVLPAYIPAAVQSR